MGYYLGKTLKNDVPYFKGLNPESLDHLKELGASMAATGSIALYHVEGHTPEYKEALEDKGERIQVEEKDVKEIAKLLKIREKSPKIPVLITASRVVKALADTLGYTEVIERYNGKIIADACLIVSPVEKWYRGIATNSGKASFYFSSFGLKVRLEDTEKLILEAP